MKTNGMHNELCITSMSSNYFLNMCLDCGPDPRIKLTGDKKFWLHFKDPTRGRRQ